MSDIAYIIATIEAKYELEYELTKDTPYFTLTGELWGVFYEHFGENLPHQNGTALFLLGSYEQNILMFNHVKQQLCSLQGQLTSWDFCHIPLRYLASRRYKWPGIVRPLIPSRSKH